jgi:UDP-glucose 4-epimerase
MVKTALVTGGGGFIGSHLVDLLLEHGYNVTIVDDLSLGKIGNVPKGVDFIQLDVRRLGPLKTYITEFSEPVDVIFNLAVNPLPMSLSTPREVVDTNVGITTAVCELVRHHLADTLIHFSSSEVYGTARYVPMDESHPLDCRTPYAASKAACDQVVQSYGRTFGIDYAIVRPFNVIGPRQNMEDWAGVVPATIKRCMRGEASVIHGDGSFTRDFSYVDDVVRAAVDIWNTPETRGKVVNVGSGVETTIECLITSIADLFDSACSVVHDSERPGDVARMVADTTLARKLIDYEPRYSLDEAIEKTVAWYVRSGKSTSPA